MTGFGRSEGVANGLTWVWEVRSVNGRGLDVRLRTPPGMDNLETAIRDVCTKNLARGNVSATLTLDRQSAQNSVRLNEQVLADVLKAANRVAELTGGQKPDTASLLSIKGVLESGEAAIESEDEKALRDRALLAGFEVALGQLLIARRSEGGRLQVILNEQIDAIARLTSDVRASPSRSPDAIRTRLADMIKRVMETGQTFDSDRLHQEAILTATRADVEEELARLETHVATAREILSSNGAAGRKLDFLAQEFNREANTLCSKSNAVDVTRAGLALKTVIDQLREQVQNVE